MSAPERPCCKSALDERLVSLFHPRDSGHRLPREPTDLHPLRARRRHHLRLVAAHPGRRQVGPDARHVLRLARQQVDGVVFGNLLLHQVLRQVGQQHPARRCRHSDEENGLGLYSDRTRRVLRVFFGLQVSPYEETETDQTPLGPLHGGLDEITK